MPVLLLTAAAYVLLSPALDRASRSRMPTGLFAGTVGIALGAYDGFFGPGVGSLWLLSLVTLAGQRLDRATAHANLLNLVGTASALAVLASHGRVVVWVGLCLGAGQILGSWIGSRLVIGSAVRWVRPLMVVTTVGAATRLIFG